MKKEDLFFWKKWKKKKKEDKEELPNFDFLEEETLTEFDFINLPDLEPEEKTQTPLLLAKGLIEENLQTQNPSLDLGNCGLNGTEDTLALLADCRHLETLILSNEWWEYDLETQKGETKYSQNEGKPNKLIQLPTQLPKNLKKLVMAGEEYGNKWEIQDLEALKDLKSLQYLSFNSNQVQDLEALKDLKNLQYLDFSKNQVQVQDLEALKDLKNLQTLYFSENQVQDLEALKDLKNLQTLYFDSNQVQDLEALKDLKNLQTLYFHSNQVQDLEALKDLKNLQTLSFSSNQVQDLEALKDLKNLQTLSFSSNQVQDIASLKDLKNLQYLYFHSNPFYEKLPEEIQAKDSLEILQYWLDTYGQETLVAQPVREAKVVFVGEGGSGKTSLMHLLLYGTKEETTRTEKIEIHTDTENFTYGENKEKLTLRFWDFGGQDIMHATHKFFMSSRTLYVLLSNGRKNEDDALRDWVEMLQSSVGDSPVLLVANHLDNPADKHRIPDLELKRVFENIQIPVIETSWQTERGIEDLRNTIQAHLQQMPHFQEDFSAKYQAVKEKLLEIEKPYIDYSTYEDMCEEVAEAQETDFTESSQSLLADFLNDLGVMLNFRKANDKLEDLLIFKPDWIVEGVYKIINAGEAQSQKGKIREKTVHDLLKSVQDSKGRKLYRTSQERNFIINMMRHFNLAFEYAQMQETYYLIPSLFEKNRPASIEKKRVKENLLRVRFEYEIWRNDYISYFLVNQHTHIKSQDYWINGAILDYGKNKVFVEAIRTKKSMLIEVWGEKDTKYAFLRVREALTQIHEMFDVAKLGISMFVVYEEDGKVDEFSYTRLQKMYENGRKYEYSEVFNKDIDIANLLGEVSLNQEETAEAINRAILSLENASITGYFDEMDTVELAKDLRFRYAKLKNEFIGGDFNVQTAERLEVFAKEVAKRLKIF